MRSIIGSCKIKDGRSLIKADNSESLEPVAEISFRYGNPATEKFPVKVWRKLLSRHCHYNPAVFDYTYAPAGYLPLRKAISCQVFNLLVVIGCRG